jgi:hypothetical protein
MKKDNFIIDKNISGKKIISYESYIHVLSNKDKIPIDIINSSVLKIKKTPIY